MRSRTGILLAAGSGTHKAAVALAEYEVFA
jgi:hypothetical protein